MGAVAAIGAAIGGAIASAAAAVASAVAAAATAIASAVAAIGSAIAGAVSTVVSAVTGALAAVGSAIGGAVSSIASFVQGPVAMFGQSVWKWGKYIYDTVSAFTEAIHLDVILKVHDIAYILSSDYREMIDGLIRKIADLGRAIGASPDGILMAMKNAETLVKSVGAIMGRSYDLTEVTWLKTLSTYLKESKDKIKEMEHGLRLILPDIEENVIKPLIDTLASEQRSFFSIFEGMGKTIEETTSNIKGLFDDIDGIRRSLTDIAMNLPDFIQDEVSPWLDDINEKFNYFKEDIYQPFMSETNDLINMLRGSMDTQKQEVDGIIDRLLMPADYLKEIEDFTKGRRENQEDKISELSSRTRKRETDALEPQTSITFERLEAIKDILEQEFPPAEWKIEEIGKLVTPIGGQAKAVDTWYVGDY